MAEVSVRHSLSRNRVLALLMAGALTAGLAGAALAAPPRTGDRISLFDPPATFPADTAFWIGHGWCLTQEELDEGVVDSPSDVIRRASRFELFVDDVAVPLATDLQRDVDICVVQKFNFHNFRAGLPAGAHHFRGEWYLAGSHNLTMEADVEFE